MLATVNFLAVPDVCLANGDYPLFVSKAIALGYSIETMSNIKCTPDLDQTLTVPVFDDYETVNMVAIDETLYWVMGIRTSTNTTNSVSFNLSYCAPSDQILSGDSMTGVFTRLPTNLCPYLKQNVSDDALENATYTNLTTIIDNYPTFKATCGVHGQIYWVEVVSTEDLLNGSTSDLIRYGFFGYYDPDYASYAPRKIHDSSGRYYPGVLEFIVDPETFGISADTILSISVSPICPYRISAVDGSTLQMDLNYTDSAQSLTYIGNCTKVVSVPTYPGSSSSVSVGIIQLDKLFYTGLESYGYLTPIPSSWVSCDLSLSAMQRALGTVSLCDQRGTAVSTLPTQIADSSGLMDLSFKCVSDFTGLYIHVRLDDYTNHTVVIPCGYLPYVGDAWQEYLKRSYATDREAMNNTIENAKIEATQQLAVSTVQFAGRTASSLVSSIGLDTVVRPGSKMAGAIDAATDMAVSAMQSEFNLSNTIRSAEQTQALIEHRVQASAGTGYQTGYGIGFLIEQCVIGFGVLLQMPANITSTYFSEYCANFGYPVQGERTATAQAGYHQGRYFPTVTGPKADRVADIFRAGFRFVLKGGN